MNDIDSRMHNVEQELAATYNTGDLRSAKEALRQHNDLRKQMAVELELINEAAKSNTAVRDYAQKFAILAPQLDKKQAELQHQLNVQQIAFNIDEETAWMSQCQAQLELVTNPNPSPATLSEITNVNKKFAELERVLASTHKPVIERLAILASGQTDLIGRSAEMNRKWTELCTAVELRRAQLAAQTKELEQLDELGQIYAGMSEKWPIIENAANAVNAADEVIVNKYLARLSQLEADLQGYAEILSGSNPTKNSVANSGSETVRRKWSDTWRQCEEMQAQIAERQRVLKLQIDWLEFERDSAELLHWFVEKRGQAQTDHYGQDLEHLILIREKFGKLKDEIGLSCESRYGRLRKLGADLVAAKSAESKSIRKRLDDMKAMRDHLEQDLVRRETELNSAAELHQFNRDVQDLLKRIGDKETSFDSVADELGRDARSCDALQRKHVIFVDELNTMRIQLYELSKQSEQLREKHPGDTAESVAGEMTELIERFSKIWNSAETRSIELVQSSELFRFMGLVKDANEWIAETRQSLIGNDTIQFSDLFAVTQLRQEHDTLSFEMSQRDDVFRLVEEMCLELATSQQHPAKKEILVHTNRIMSERENLFRLWKLKSELLNVAAECHEFYRDVLKLSSLIVSQETLLTKAVAEFHLQLDTTPPPFCERMSVEDVESLLKAHENLERKIGKQSIEKLVELQKRAGGLIESETTRLAIEDQRQLFPDVNELPRLSSTVAQVSQKADALKHLCAKRAKQLNDTLKFLQLKRDIDEFLAWIEEKCRAARQMKSASASSLVLADKVKLFQKQKALSSDIETNLTRHADLTKRTQEQIVHNRTVRAQFAKQLLDELNRQWQNLACETRERAKEFDEAKDLLEFNDELEQLDAWRQEKELMLHNGDVGEDYEHCVALLKKADEAISPNNEEKLQRLLALGDKLVRMGQTDRQLVMDKRNGLLEQFKQIRSGVEQYKAKLNAALEVHAFTRDHEDLQQRVKVRISILNLIDPLVFRNNIKQIS